MKARTIHIWVVAALVLTLAPAARAQEAECSVSGHDDRCESREATVGRGIDYPGLTTFSRDQDTVYLYGQEDGGEQVLGAYNAETGRTLWLRHPDLKRWRGYMLRMELVGDRLILAGTSRTGGGAGKQDITVFAVDAADGSLLWERTFDDNGADTAAGMTVANGLAYVVGSTRRPETHNDVQLLAVDIRSGRIVWAHAHKRPERQHGGEVLAAPNGGKLFVTAYDDRGSLILAFDAGKPGRPLWSARFGSREARGTIDKALISPDGTRVYGIGHLYRDASFSLAVAAFDSGTGEIDWFHSFPENADIPWASDAVVDRSGRTLYFTGSWPGSTYADDDISLAAIDAVTGEELWVQTYGTPGYNFEFGTSVAATRLGGKVFVTGRGTTGSSSAVVTLAFDGRDGTRRWAARYEGSPGGISGSNPDRVVVGPTGSRVHVTAYVGNGMRVLSYET